MPRLFSFSFLLVVSLFLSSCATQVVYLDKGYEKDLPSYQKTEHYFFWGMGVQQRTYDLKEICQSNSKVVRLERSYLSVDALFSVLTLGVYLPQTLRIYCKK